MSQDQQKQPGNEKRFSFASHARQKRNKETEYKIDTLFKKNMEYCLHFKEKYYFCRVINNKKKTKA